MLKILIWALGLACGACAAAPCEYTVEKVVHKNLVANLYLPKADRAVPAVLAFGGSEGGLSTGNSTGEMLAPHCVAVLGLAYFKEAGLPPTLDRIPLEYFIDALDYLSGRAGIDAARIGVVSGSRGSEAALLVASMDARVKSLVVATPSEAAWGGTTGRASAWTYQGKPVPFLFMADDAALPKPARFEKALNEVDDWNTYGIHIERIRGPVFFISAAKDEIWPSGRMAEDMVKYLRAHNFAYAVRHDSYPTGHGFSQALAPRIRQSVVAHFLENL